MILQNQDGQPAQPIEGGETFFQRQRRLAGQNRTQVAQPPVAQAQVAPQEHRAQMASQAAPQPGAQGAQYATPVTGNGKIPPPAPQQAPPPNLGPQGINPNGTATHQAPVPAPPSPDPFAAMGGGVWTGQQWVPKDHPLASGQAHMPPGGGGQQPLPGGGVNFGAAVPPQRPDGTNLEPFALDAAIPDAYTPDKFTGFNAPDQSVLNTGQADLMSAILNNPQTLNPTVVEAMKNRAKEDQLLAAKQAEMRNASSAAARGVSGGGNEAGINRRIYDSASSNILRNNQDLDINAAQTNRQNELDALGAAEQMLSGQMGRATAGFGATLAGETAQADANRAGVASNFDRSRFEMDKGLSQFGINQAIAGNARDNYATDLSAYFGNRDANRSDRALDINRELGQGGLDIDRSRLTETGRQFDAGHGLDIMRFLEGQRQADNSLGFNYSQLNQQGQQSLIDRILGLMPR